MNEPSFWGQGKEYNSDGLKPRPAANGEEGDLWSKVHSAWSQLGVAMVEFGFHRFGSHIQEAWKDFNLGAEHGAYDARSPENSIFIPYFLYRWKDQADRAAGFGRAPAGGTIVRAFLAGHRRLLSPMVAEIAQIAMQQPFSFYEIIASQPGKGMRVQEIFTGQKFDVRERSTSACVRHGDILYGQITPMAEIAAMAFCSPLIIPPRMKPEIIACRRMFKTLFGARDRGLSKEDLPMVEEGIRASYLRIRNQLEGNPGDNVSRQGTAKEAPALKAESKKTSPERGTLVRHTESLEFSQKEVDAWVHKKLSALWGRTPLQAMKDADGREAVAALILDYERKAEASVPASARPDFSALWQMLQPAKKKRVVRASGLRTVEALQPRL
ncbi:MAG TPA: hypothetical protein VNW97_02095 [Candidatus Saccharimonadales bacterium]|nr:hypothetical protein [Candidatus Saccharimonadales bacterium]